MKVSARYEVFLISLNKVSIRSKTHETFWNHKNTLPMGGKGWRWVGDGNGELMFSFKTSLSRLTYLRLDFKITEKSEKTFPKLLENQCHLVKKVIYSNNRWIKK